MPAKHIAIVTCSTRSPRLNPGITQYIYDVLTNDPALPTTPPETTDNNPRHIQFTILDLAKQSLPLYDDTVIPASLPPSNPTPHYTKPHTQAWSSLVQSYDAFIFVTPQYNGSIPASLKNALDYLFHEWKGKPAGIVSYGSGGGGEAAEHLRGVLTELRMRVVRTAPTLVVRFTGLPVRGSEEEQGRVVLDGRDLKGWKEAGVQGILSNLGMELVCELDHGFYG